MATSDDGSGSGGTLYRLVPGFVRRRLDRHAELRRIVFNLNWLVGQRAFDSALGLVIGVVVLRYLGPERYGVLSYVGSIVGLGVPFAMLGLSNVVVRNLVTRREDTGAILGTATGLRLIAGLLAMGAVVLATILLRTSDERMVWFAAIIAAGHVCQSPGIVAAWFQSTVNARYNVMARSGSKTVFALAKVLMVALSASLWWFVASAAAELALASLLLVVFFARKSGTSLRSFTFRVSDARQLLRESWPLTLSGFMTVVYMRTDQVMLGQLLDERSVGIYASAVRLSELLYLVPGMVTGSVFPSLLRARQQDPGLYRKRLQLLYDGLLWLSAAAALLVNAVGPWVVRLLFGPAYAGAAGVLVIHVWSAMFLFVGAASQKYLVAEQLTRITLFATGAGACANVAANLLLIPRFGINGAAVATLVSMAFSHLIAQSIFRESRPAVGFVLRALNPIGVARRWREVARAGGASE
jgi:PST family polysaccharide transporter